MASESSLKHRIRDDTTDTATSVSMDMDDGSRHNKGDNIKRIVMAKRGLRSLAVAVAFPLSLTIFNIYLFGGSSHSYVKLKQQPFWVFPPSWVIHTATMASSFLMGLSAWLVWAEGAFHKKPTVLYLYLAQLALSLSWVTVVCGIGGYWLGLVLCLALFGALVGCSRLFKEINPIAADLVKPCFASAAFLAFVNLELLLL